MDDSATTIRELTSNLLGDYLRFFDYDAFADNSEWASCYCYFYLHAHSTQDWETRSAADNRQAVSQLIAEDKMCGYLAFVDDKPVAWCHAAPRTMLTALQEDDDLAAADSDHIGAIVCFIVAPTYRRMGIASQLLEAACAGLQRQGMTVAEAYPRRGADTDAANYHGAMAMYVRAGFVPFRELDGAVVMRRALG